MHRVYWNQAAAADSSLYFSFFFHSNFHTWKCFVTLFLGTVRPRRLKLVTHGNRRMYPVYVNHAAALIHPFIFLSLQFSECGGSVVECRTPEREVGGSKPTAAMLCPWARHFTPRKYWLITQEAVAPSRHDWKIVDWDVKPQHKQSSVFKQRFSSHFSQELWGLENWN